MRSLRHERRWETAAGLRELGPELTVEVPDGVRTACHRYSETELLPERLECGLRLIRPFGDPSFGSVSVAWLPSGAVRLPWSTSSQVAAEVLGRPVSFGRTEGDHRVLRARVRFDAARQLKLFVQASDEATERGLLHTLATLRRR
ncbi:MAG: hypothetical protein AB8I08_35100 [Sandaracinaceae bacterium]